MDFFNDSAKQLSRGLSARHLINPGNTMHVALLVSQGRHGIDFRCPVCWDVAADENQRQDHARHNGKRCQVSRTYAKQSRRQRFPDLAWLSQIHYGNDRDPNHVEGKKPEVSPLRQASEHGNGNQSGERERAFEAMSDFT